MRRLIPFAAMLLLGLAGVAQGADVLDRVLLIVNNAPILQSDWEEAVRCEALVNGRDPASLDETERKDAFERLLDQQLIIEQMRGYALPAISDAQVQQQIKVLRKQIDGGETDKGWALALERAGVTEHELEERTRTQLEILQFLDIRFRTGIRIDNRSVTRYYNETFLPQLRKTGAAEVPLAEVRGKIREILLQQRMQELTSDWIASLRDGADIRLPAAPPEKPIEELQSK